MIFAVGLANWEIIDAGKTAAHVAVLIKLPIFVSIGAEPIAGIIVPLVGKSDGDPVLVKGPKFFDESVLQFLAPFADQKLCDGLASRKEFRAVPPNSIDCVRKRDTLRVACVPGVLRHPDFLGGSLGVEGWK